MRVNCNTRNRGLQHAQPRICGSATTPKCALCIQTVPVENNFQTCGQEATQTHNAPESKTWDFPLPIFGSAFPRGESRKTRPCKSGQPGFFLKRTWVGKSGWGWLSGPTPATLADRGCFKKPDLTGILSPSQPDLLNLLCVVVSEPQTRGVWPFAC